MAPASPRQVVPAASVSPCMESADGRSGQTFAPIGRIALEAAFARGYRVDDSGAVVSPAGHAIATHRACGYQRFCVRVGRRAVSVFVHRLAAYQCFGAAMFAPGVEVRHLDGDRANSRPANLALGTRSENSLDRDPVARRRHGQHAQDGRRVLTQSEAEAVRAARSLGASYTALAAQFGINPGIAWNICHERTYVDLSREAVSRAA